MSIRKGSSIIAGNIGQNIDSTLSLLSVNPVQNKVITEEIRKNLSSKNISNCITEIPQDIKLELNNGALTLKAGSKVYVPNGFEEDGITPKFDMREIQEDIVDNGVTRNTTCPASFLCVSSSLTLSFITPSQESLSWCFSGPTAPVVTTTYAYWYDTANNLIMNTSNGGTTWTPGYSFPIGIVNCIPGAWNGINQIFNGFGYIGSTVFALPGVKGLAPKGRNADGTLLSNNIGLTNVNTRTLTGTGKAYITMQQSSFGMVNVADYTYDEETNRQYSGTSVFSNGVVFASCNITSGVISNFKTKPVFHAVDYNDTEFMAHQAMPSNRYIELTLGASGSTYTAPADGYVVFRKQASAVGQYMQLNINNASQIQYWLQSATTNGLVGATIPVKKGDNFGISYTLAGTANQVFKFVYAEGAQ